MIIFSISSLYSHTNRLTIVYNTSSLILLYNVGVFCILLLSSSTERIIMSFCTVSLWSYPKILVTSIDYRLDLILPGGCLSIKYHFIVILRALCLSFKCDCVFILTVLCIFVQYHCYIRLTFWFLSDSNTLLSLCL